MDSPASPPEKLSNEVVHSEKVSSNAVDASMEWTDADEKRIRRKMDFRIVPAVFALYLLCFIDR